MSIEETETQPTKSPAIYIVSGGVGASGQQIAHTLLAQFPESKVPIITVPHVRHREQIEAVVNDAALQHGLILHTLVDPHLRTSLIHLAQMQGVIAVDLVGDLLTHLAGVLGQEPLIHPGRYRQINEVYFKRVEAMEFTIAHDDGNRPQDWPLAEIVLAGLSRVGKTPLSVYLSLQGWKVANVPLVMGLPSPPELFELDRRRVIGLHLEPGQLLFHRQQRQRQLGAPGPSAYIDPVKIYEEVEAARREFKRGGFSVIDITDKPVETIADEVIELMTRRFKTNP
jgi:hypothetical protein